MECLQEQVEIFLKSDLTWHRPTQKFGSVDNFFNILWNNALNDKFKIFKEEEFIPMLIKIINYLKKIEMLLELWTWN